MNEKGSREAENKRDELSQGGSFYYLGIWCFAVWGRRNTLRLFSFVDDVELVM